MKTVEQKERDEAYFKQQDVEANVNHIGVDTTEMIFIFLYVVGIASFFGFMLMR